ETIRNESKIYLPYGRGRHAPISGEDLARVIVGVLLNPAPHRGKSYIPTGPRSLSMSEMAAVFARVLRRPVVYVEIPVDKWRQILARIPVLSTHFLDHIGRVAEAHQRGEFDAQTDIVKQIGGSLPKSLETFIEEHRTEFGG